MAKGARTVYNEYHGFVTDNNNNPVFSRLCWIYSRPHFIMLAIICWEVVIGLDRKH